MSDNAPEIEYIEADAEYIQLNQTEVMETEVEVTDDCDDPWTSCTIKLMLNLYLKNIDKFRNPKIRKKSVWVDIANAVGRDPDSCDKKFRNLKQTYIRLLKKRNQNCGLPLKWPYFNLFEEIYTVDGEYKPEIQTKLQENPTDIVTKALLAMNSPKAEIDMQENGECSKRHSERLKRINKKRFMDLRKVSIEMRDRQRVVEEKLDRLINIVEESNNIQRERNDLFQQFLDKLNRT